jgi:hypothetical protein
MKILILGLFLLPMSVIGQNDKNGNWLMYFGSNRIHDKLSIHTELQYRNHTIAPVNAEQLLLRTGINYHFSKNSFASAGYAFIGNHDYLSEQLNPEVEEHRVWQQFIVNDYVGRLKFEHRYRIEQRWVNKNYLNRFRYRLMIFVPLNKPQIEKGTIFLGVYDEVFINAKETFFDRNRLYGALGYQINKSASVQLGLMYQQTSNLGKGYLQFGITYNPDFRKKQ